MGTDNSADSAVRLLLPGKCTSSLPRKPGQHFSCLDIPPLRSELATQQSDGENAVPRVLLREFHCYVGKKLMSSRNNPVINKKPAESVRKGAKVV